MALKQKQLSITVESNLEILDTDPLPSAVVGQPYSHQLQAAGGDGTYSWLLVGGTLPDGVSINASGLIAGTPTAEQTKSFTVQVNSPAV